MKEADHQALIDLYMDKKLDALEKSQDHRRVAQVSDATHQHSSQSEMSGQRCSRMVRILIGVLTAVALSTPSVAQDLRPNEIAAIDKAVTQALKDGQVPSAQVAVVRGAKLVLDRAWGKASERIPIATPDLPYQIASNSKQFLSALLLLLRNDGKVSLDDTVARWLPEITGADRITVRQLLSHTSGLQDYWPQDYNFAAMQLPVMGHEIVERWAKKPLDYSPGTRWQYSNTGYIVAGLIAEKAGGKPLWQQFEERLFRPLGIHPVTVDDTNGPAFPQGYHRQALGSVRPATPAARGWLWAAAELSMTAAELAKWDIARLDRSLLRPEDWVEQETPIVLADGTSSGYGLGVSVRLVADRRIIDHGGESVGYLSQNAVWPDAKTAVVVLTNGDFSGVADTLTEKIGAIVLPKAVQTDTGEIVRTDDVRTELTALAKGRLDPRRHTENSRYYFTADTLADYRNTLTKLGKPMSVESLRTPRLRGGFVNRNFRVKWRGTTLRLVTYAEPGAHGRWEQFMLMPE